MIVYDLSGNVISELDQNSVWKNVYLRLDGKLFWLAQFSGWNGERFVVVEVTPKRVEARINVFGGGC